MTSPTDQRPCKNCEDIKENHAGTKCLYESTYYETLNDCDNCFNGWTFDESPLDVAFCQCPLGRLVKRVQYKFHYKA